METSALNVICDSLNSIFFKIFSSIDNAVYSVLDDISFLDSSIVREPKFQQIFGTDSTNGFLLIANSLIFGIILFYIFQFALSHLTYSKIDSPYQFIFKCIIFICCMNSSLWICEKILEFVSIISDGICEIGQMITGSEISFSSLIDTLNSVLMVTSENFDFCSFDGILKILSSCGFFYILLMFSARYIMCKILVLLAPFAFLSLINNRLDGFFKGWIHYFLTTLSMQILISIALLIGLSLDLHTSNILSKLILSTIIFVIAKCNYSLKGLFSQMRQYSHNKLRDFI